MDGTNEANDGIGQIQSALTEIERGIMSGSIGAGEAKAGLQEVKQNLDKTIAGNKQILGGYKQIAAGLAEFGNVGSTDLSDLKKAITGAKLSVEGMNEISIAHSPNLQTDEKYQTAYQTAIRTLEGLASGVQELDNELSKLATAAKQVKTDVV